MSQAQRPLLGLLWLDSGQEPWEAEQDRAPVRGAHRRPRHGEKSRGAARGRAGRDRPGPAGLGRGGRPHPAPADAASRLGFLSRLRPGILGPRLSPGRWRRGRAAQARWRGGTWRRRRAGGVGRGAGGGGRRPAGSPAT